MWPATLAADIRAYLEAENAYTEATLADTTALQETLFQEMKARLKEDDRQVPQPGAVTRDDQVEHRPADLGADYADLSMGMSGDFELAIEHGATTVRVGQAIFGAR